MNQMPAPTGDQFLGSQCAPLPVVTLHCCRPIIKKTLHCDHRNMNPVKQLNRHCTAAQNDSCHPVSRADINIFPLLFLDALRIAQQNAVPSLVRLILYIADHLRKIRMSYMRHNQPDCICILSLQ